MTRRIVLLTNHRDAPHFWNYLRRCNPNLDISAAHHLNELYAEVRGGEKETRLISCMTRVIVPAEILDQLGPTPYNIHPGPPEYPGSFPEAFAIWEQADTFGATAHEMVEAVDAGPIVHVERFPMPHRPTLQQLVDQLYPLVVKTFAIIAHHCAASDDALPRLDEHWASKKGTRKAFRALCQSAAECTPDDYERLRRACGKDLVEPHIRAH